LIVLDASALVAVYFEDPEAESFLTAIFRPRPALSPPPMALEYLMVATRRKQPRRGSAADPATLLERPGPSIVPRTQVHLPIARDAFARYGKDQGIAAS